MHSAFYNAAVPRKPPSKPAMPVRQRLAAFLSFIAVVFGLLSPSLILAQELRSGKLGSLCGAGSQLAALKTGTGLNAGADAAFDALSPPVHCALCGSSPAAVSPFIKLPAVVGERQSANPGDVVWVAPQVHRGFRCIRGPPSF